MSTQPPIRFAAIGLNHNHIYGQTGLLLNAGAELVAFYSAEDDLAAEYNSRFDQAVRKATQAEILEDESLDLIVSAAIPCERPGIGIQAMHHGKDYMSDKPGFTTLEQLAEVRKIQAETGRIYSINYSERLETRVSGKIDELLQAGAIGKVIQTLGLGPHRTRLPHRPDWFFDESKYGGIICDIASHQFDQYLHYTGSTDAEVVHAQVANYNHPQHPGLQDFGDVVLRSEGCTGYIRVDWFTPDGLATWGDGRLVIMGTDGYIEARKYLDIAGREGANHLFLVNNDKTEYFDCSNVPLPYGPRLIDDIRNRTETAMGQEHCFKASELALKAQAQATRLGNLVNPGRNK